jgi:uncharacterized protein YjbI with pentapeptide repeats
MLNYKYVNEIKRLIWFVWDFSGFRFIFSKILPPKSGTYNSKRSPSTFLLWIIGIYVAIFTLASNKYEYKKNIIDNKICILVNNITSSPNNKDAFARLARIQKIRMPIEPNFFKPYKTVRTLIGPNVLNDEIVKAVKEIFEYNKDILNNAYLANIDLSNCDLNYANFENSRLHGANFENSFLVNVNFSKCILERSNFQNSFLMGSKFIDSSLMRANLRNAKVHRVKFNNCDLRCADLTFDKEEIGSSGLKADQLSSAYSLTGIKCSEEIFNVLESKYPRLFTENKPLKKGTVELIGAEEW